MSSLLTLKASAFLAKIDNRPIVLPFEGLHWARCAGQHIGTG
jgi:hypothetical protein